MRGDIRIGEFLVQARLNRLVCGDREICIEPKVMDVLVYLAEHYGEVCSKEQIICSVWADTFVTDDVLKHAIFELRKAFSDDARNPAYIRTVPRRGYQLLAKVLEGDLDRYRILKKLGEGAMGEVWLAHDQLLRRYVALKLLAGITDDEKSAQRLLREARSVAALDHPFICRVYDTGHLEGRFFIAMEYIKGRTLKERLDEGPLTLDETLKLGCEVAEAMEEASEKGFVHRDLKPSNIMLSEPGHIKVMDFGVAKRSNNAPHEDWTLTGSGEAPCVGTLPYMSPEQVRQRSLDTRSDIFSLGVVLYEAFFGIRLFLRSSPVETGSAILNEDLPPLLAKRSHIPVQLHQVLSKMLAKDPNSRLQSFREVQRELRLLKTLVTGRELKSRLSKSRKALLFCLSLIFLGMALVVSRSNLLDRPSSSQPVLQPVPVSSAPESESHPSLAPDGRRLAYVSGTFPDRKIFVKQIGIAEGVPLQLTHSGEASGPVWAPNGEHIFFLSRIPPPEMESLPKERASWYQVCSVPALGGTVRVWTKIHTTLLQYYATPHLAPTPDGRSIVIAGHPETEEGRGLYLLSLETQEMRELTKPPEPGFFDLSPCFSPNKDALAFLRMSGQGVADLYLLRFDEELQPIGKPERLSSVPVDFTGLTWDEGGKELIYSAGPIKNWQLWRVRIKEPEFPELLAFAGSGVRYPSVSHQNNRLVYQKREVDYNIYRLNLDEPGTPTEEPQLFQSSSRFDAQANYSPDGQKVALTSERNGRFDLYSCNLDGTNVAPLIPDDKWIGDSKPTLGIQLFLPKWSPDGQWIAFEACREGFFEIYVLSAGGGLPRRLGRGDFPTWSPDSRSVQFITGYGGVEEVWKASVEGGDAVKVDNIEFGRSPDGEWRYLASSYFFPSRKWKQSIRGGQLLPLTGLTGVSPQVVQNKIYTLNRLPNEVVFQAYDIETEETQEIFVSEERSVLSFSVSPDGRTLLFDRADYSRIDIMMVEGFH